MPIKPYVVNDTSAHLRFPLAARGRQQRPAAAVAGAYANSALIKADTVRAGFDEAWC
jgi:branched-subunit amino acid aminotransferase/4-amino-4-deoxychorismate lyase